MIYFLLMEEGGIKIGHSVDVDRRLREIRGEHDGPVVLLRTSRGGFAAEARIHRRFRYLRFWSSEQFRPAPELLDFMGLCPLPRTAPDDADRTPTRSERHASRRIARMKEEHAAGCR